MPCIDTTFKIGIGFNGHIYSLVLQPDGKILVGGGFTSYQGVTTKGLIRLNTDGSKDSSFNMASEFNYIGSVQVLSLQSDGKILVGGGYPSSSSSVLFRLNKDGSIDSSFGSGFQVSNPICSIVPQTDGKILLSGYFSSKLIRFNSDGTKDTAFDIGTGFGSATDIVYSVALQPDGQILVGGQFGRYKDDNSSVYLIRLKGTATNLSNENFNKNENLFSLWPNPVYNILNINVPNNSFSVAKIYDLQGKLIYSKEKETSSIDISNFNNGIYLIKLQTENGEISNKFIKQ